jgi:hypothetical protein
MQRSTSSYRVYLNLGIPRTLHLTKSAPWCICYDRNPKKKINTPIMLHMRARHDNARLQINKLDCRGYRSKRLRDAKQQCKSPLCVNASISFFLAPFTQFPKQIHFFFFVGLGFLAVFVCDRASSFSSGTLSSSSNRYRLTDPASD